MYYFEIEMYDLFQSETGKAELPKLKKRNFPSSISHVLDKHLSYKGFKLTVKMNQST